MLFNDNTLWYGEPVRGATNGQLELASAMSYKIYSIMMKKYSKLTYSRYECAADKNMYYEPYYEKGIIKYNIADSMKEYEFPEDELKGFMRFDFSCICNFYVRCEGVQTFWDTTILDIDDLCIKIFELVKYIENELIQFDFIEELACDTFYRFILSGNFEEFYSEYQEMFDSSESGINLEDAKNTLEELFLNASFAIDDCIDKYGEEFKVWYQNNMVEVFFSSWSSNYFCEQIVPVETIIFSCDIVKSYQDFCRNNEINNSELENRATYLLSFLNNDASFWYSQNVMCEADYCYSYPFENASPLFQMYLKEVDEVMEALNLKYAFYKQDKGYFSEVIKDVKEVENDSL